MWSDGGPIDPSPTIDQAINGGYPWLEIKCSRCKTPSDVDLCALRHVPTTCVHDLAGRLVCQTEIRLPLLPQQRTCGDCIGRSVLCQKATFRVIALIQINAQRKLSDHY